MLGGKPPTAGPSTVSTTLIRPKIDELALASSLINRLLEPMITQIVR
jgi:hypothetical protein